MKVYFLYKQALQFFIFRETYLLTLRLLICAVGGSLSSETKSLAESISASLIGVSDETCRVAAGAALGALVAHSLTDEEAAPVLKKTVLSKGFLFDLLVGAISVDIYFRH